MKYTRTNEILRRWRDRLDMETNKGSMESSQDGRGILKSPIVLIYLKGKEKHCYNDTES